MSKLTEKAKKEIRNEIKEQKRRKNILWVISYRRENAGNIQSWLQKKTDVSFLVQNSYYNCLIWKLCANNPPWFLRNPLISEKFFTLHTLLSKPTAGGGGHSWTKYQFMDYKEDTLLYEARANEECPEPLRRYRRTSRVVAPYREKIYSQILPLQLSTLLLLLLFLIFFIWWEMWCIHQTMRDGRLVLSGSRRQVLGAAWDSISWEEVCKRQIRHFSARKHLQWTGNLQAARQVFHRISPHSSGTLPAPLTWTWARSCPLTWNVDFGETLWKKVSSSHTLAGT